MSDRFTILIVDDEPNILRSIKRLLIDTDYKVLLANSAEEALEVFEQHKIHMILSDYRMSGKNGVELLSEIRKSFPATIRIILSGYADVESIVEAINKGHIYKFISKPWNDQELLTTISTAVEQYILKQENEELYGKLEQRNKELQRLTESLEEKVEERTRTLEMNIRALKITQNILNLLPLGVIGIDSDGVIVYMNDSLKHYIDTSNLYLGAYANETLSEKLMKLTIQSQFENRPVTHSGDTETPAFMAIPLPEHAGIIGLFGAPAGDCHGFEKYCEYIDIHGAANVR